ncbi:hypothetical protein KIW84_060830 [Lathyrus oleraceus]|uniref:Uncharacterized protein n=1 Tax=Pisum sativum TaxID=3888 RepID=A0A9D5A5U2_PEA|nr:hypothetical protein KIW84_060830 [Pisum sativum]
MGRFDRDCLVYYTEGNGHVVEIDPDRWSLFEATCIVKELTELEHLEYWLWWYNNDADKYSRMDSDSDVDKVKAMQKKLMYVVFKEENVRGVEQVEEDNVGGIEQVEEDNVGGAEHVEEANVGDVEQVEEANVGGVEQVEDTEDIEDKDFEPNGLSFDDSEDERALGLDDCFDFIENQVEEKGKEWLDNEMIINYADDELGSSDLDAFDGEKEPKYPRVLNDSYVTFKWVAKMVVAKMTSSDGVKIHDIVFEIKSNFSDGITMSRAWKAKQIAKALIQAQTATQEELQPNETQIDVDPEFEMLATNLASAFERTQTQLNLVVNGPIASAPSHSVLVTSAQGEPVTSSQIDDVPAYILSAPVPTTDDVSAVPTYTTQEFLN